MSPKIKEVSTASLKRQKKSVEGRSKAINKELKRRKK